jgi:hypothetical protein
MRPTPIKGSNGSSRKPNKKSENRNTGKQRAVQVAMPSQRSIVKAVGPPATREPLVVLWESGAARL